MPAPAMPSSDCVSSYGVYRLDGGRARTLPHVGLAHTFGVAATRPAEGLLMLA